MISTNETEVMEPGKHGMLSANCAKVVRIQEVRWKEA